MTNDCLLVEQNNPIATITLNRPQAHNAFDETLIGEITACFERLSDDTGVRAIVLRGAGESFCAGADLHWMRRMADYSEEENRADAANLQRMFAAIAACPKPTLARVHGAAIGGGAGLVAVCDIAIASSDTKFAFSEVRLGLVPAVIAPYVLQKIGMGASRALFVTGERFGADEALRLGLIQQVAPDEDYIKSMGLEAVQRLGLAKQIKPASELDAAVQKKIELILQAGPQAIAVAKRLLNDIADNTPEQAAETTIACIAALRVSPEGQEGIRAFLEKRKPEWSC